jgi:serine/threonine protein kinase
MNTDNLFQSETDVSPPTPRYPFYRGLHMGRNITLDDVKNFFELIDNCETILSKTYFIQRIGSLSRSAFVFLANVRDNNFEQKFAVKYEKNISKAESEIDINKFLLDNYPDYFLNMYYGTYCEDVNVLNQITSGYFMFMEVSVGDLKQIIKYGYITEKELKQILNEILDSLTILSHASIYHGDLHAGNVFIVERDGVKRAVIGDFGESMFSSAPTRHLSDLYYLLASLKEILKGRYPLIDKLLKFVSVQTGKTERDFENLVNNLPEEIQTRLNLEENNVPEEVDTIMNELISRDIDIIKEML